MKNILRYIETVFLALLLLAPFTVFASSSGKQSDLNFAFESQTKNMNTKNSETALKFNTDGDSSANTMPKIHFSSPFPNPASSFIKINYSFPSTNDYGELRIMDLTGKTVKTYPLEGSNNSLRINISDLTRGLYFCTMYYKGQLIKSNKLIVSNR